MHIQSVVSVVIVGLSAAAVASPVVENAIVRRTPQSGQCSFWSTLTGAECGDDEDDDEEAPAKGIFGTFGGSSKGGKGAAKGPSKGKAKGQPKGTTKPASPPADGASGFFGGPGNAGQSTAGGKSSSPGGASGNPFGAQGAASPFSQPVSPGSFFGGLIGAAKGNPFGAQGAASPFSQAPSPNFPFSGSTDAAQPAAMPGMLQSAAPQPGLLASPEPAQSSGPAKSSGGAQGAESWCNRPDPARRPASCNNLVQAGAAPAAAPQGSSQGRPRAGGRGARGE